MCFLSYLQNGFVNCRDTCPPVNDCYILDKSNGTCCRRCKGKSKYIYILFYPYYSCDKKQAIEGALIYVRLCHSPGCSFRGMSYESGSEWNDPEDPCKTYKCVATVVTETIQKCYSQCDNNQLQPPRPGECCPTCQGESCGQLD